MTPRRITYTRPGLIGEPVVVHEGYADMTIDEASHTATFERYMNDGTRSVSTVRLTRIRGKELTQ